MSVSSKFRKALLSLKKRFSSTDVDRAKPLLVVIGAQKSGTTALFQYLSMHPQLEAPAVKELNFFNSRSIGSKELRGYARNFPTLQDDIDRSRVTGSFDVSPAYMLDAEQVVGRIYEYAPDMKIVALLRNPIARAYSAWNMYRKYYEDDHNWFLRQPWVRTGVDNGKRVVKRTGNFGEDFEADILEELDVLACGNRIEMPIVEFGFYKSQLQAVYDVFPRESILVLDSSEFRENGINQLRKLENLIGVESHQWSNDVLVPHFVGCYDQSMTDSAKERMREVYRDETRDLCALVGRTFSWQSDFM